MKEDKIITFAEIKRKIQGKKIEELTKEEIADRYIMYGNEQELKQPQIQKQFIKYGYIEELTDMVTIITDKQVIQQILQSNLFEKNKNLILKRGQLKKIRFEHFEELADVLVSMFTFKDTDGKVIKLYGHIFSINNIEDIHKYREEISTHRDNIIVLLDNRNNKMYLRCFLKFYKDIDYNSNGANGIS